MKVREDSFPPTLLKDLPNLQFVARLADGRTLKGYLQYKVGFYLSN